MDKDVVKVLERLRQLRLERNLSLLELATRANISHSYLYYLESRKKVPSLTVLFRLATALEVPIRQFFESP